MRAGLFAAGLPREPSWASWGRGAERVGRWEDREARIDRAPHARSKRSRIVRFVRIAMFGVLCMLRVVTDGHADYGYA